MFPFFLSPHLQSISAALDSVIAGSFFPFLEFFFATTTNFLSLIRFRGEKTAWVGLGLGLGFFCADFFADFMSGDLEGLACEMLGFAFSDDLEIF
jgi:hypothetical protein